MSKETTPTVLRPFRLLALLVALRLLLIPLDISRTEIRPFWPSATGRLLPLPDAIRKPSEITSKSNSDSRRPYWTSYTVASIMFTIHRSASWSFQVVNRDPSRYDINTKTSHRGTIHSLCVFPYSGSTLWNDPDQYATSFASLLAALAIRCTRLACHNHRCQPYNFQMVLVVRVSVMTVIETVAFLGPRF